MTGWWTHLHSSTLCSVILWSLPSVPAGRHLQWGNLTTSWGQMLPDEEKNTLLGFCFLLFVFMVLRVYACFTLLYEIASNSSLICAGVWISSSLDDRGWEEARASIANTLWMSPSTMRSVYYKTNETVYLTTLSSTNTYIQNNLVLMKFLPHSTQVQHYLLPSTQHRMQSLHSATSHSTIWVSPDYQTTRGTVQKKNVRIDSCIWTSLQRSE